MTIEEIQRAVNQGRAVARYRDQWGFITSGVILGIEGGDVLIDNLKNHVKPDQVLSIRFI